MIDGVFVPGSVKIPENVKTPEEVAEWYANEYAENFRAVSKLSGEQLIKVVDFRGLFQRPAFTFLQAGLLHTVHHRGQLSTYLRPMGGKVPAIYGESYDSAEAKKSRETSGLIQTPSANLRYRLEPRIGVLRDELGICPAGSRRVSWG